MRSRKIPMYGDGGRLQAWLTVDASDYERMVQLRWTKQSKGYARHRKAGGGQVYAHRMVMRVRSKKLHVDHINGEKLDCRKANLRIVAAKGGSNHQNLHTKYGSNPERNVYPNGRGWQVALMVSGKRHYLGSYRSLTRAKEVARNARKEMMPFSPEGTRARNTRS